MSDTPPQDPVRQPLVDLLPMLRTLWMRRFLIVGIAVAFVVIGAAYLAVTKPGYTAQAVILVDPREPNTTDTNNVLPGIGSDSAAIASQVAVISSRELLNTVFDAEDIANDAEFSQPGFIGSLLGKTPTRAEVFDAFAQNVSVGREGLTYVIDVGFLSHDPDKAARVANAIATQYIAGQIAQKTEANADVTGLLDDRIAELQQDVTDAERKVEEFRIANGIFADTNGATQLQTQTEQLEAQLLTAQDAARQAETKAAQALTAGNSPQALISLSDILVSPTAEALRTEYNQRALELSSSQSVLGPRHPTLRRLESELSRVENLMVREVERITQELVGARDVAQGVVDRIKGELAALRDQGNDANLKLVELRQLERNADASRSVLEQFLKRSAETSQFERLQFSDARVITAATAPLRATWPKPSLVLAVAGALGLMVGLGAALLLGEPKPAEAVAVVRPPVAPPVKRERRPLFAFTRRAPKPAKAPVVASKPDPAPVAVPKPAAIAPLVAQPKAVAASVAAPPRESLFAPMIRRLRDNLNQRKAARAAAPKRPVARQPVARPTQAAARPVRPVATRPAPVAAARPTQPATKPATPAARPAEAPAAIRPISPAQRLAAQPGAPKPAAVMASAPQRPVPPKAVIAPRKVAPPPHPAATPRAPVKPNGTHRNLSDLN